MGCITSGSPANSVARKPSGKVMRLSASAGVSGISFGFCVFLTPGGSDGGSALTPWISIHAIAVRMGIRMTHLVSETFMRAQCKGKGMANRLMLFWCLEVPRRLCFMSTSMITRFTTICLFGVLAASAAELHVEDKDLPRVPATEPNKAISTFQVRDGFHIELVASEPLIVSPVAMAFDENGRLFVVEMRDYSERRDERLGRIKLLEDTNGDGHFDKATIYATNLPWPTAVICYDGGIFVGASPDILYLKDTNNDGVADVAQNCVHRLRERSTPNLTCSNCSTVSHGESITAFTARSAEMRAS